MPPPPKLTFSQGHEIYDEDFERRLMQVLWRRLHSGFQALRIVSRIDDEVHRETCNDDDECVVTYALKIRFPFSSDDLCVTYVQRAAGERVTHAIRWNDSLIDNKPILIAAAAHTILLGLKTPSLPARVFSRVPWMPDEVKDLVLSHLSRFFLDDLRAVLQRMLTDFKWQVPMALENNGVE